ncbi:MAG TPA: hypothetical protein VGW33_02940 [Terriglobia bacterium]|nr:hypothetical protein [Terriglobia bacterium]
MRFPLQPGDVKIVQGSSGKGLQVECPCGAVNWNHLEIQESQWTCRNCGQVFTEYFPGLAQKVLAQEKSRTEASQPTAPPAPAGA